jgi:alpha-ketoglutarate-dependent taurine dioxygenase
MASDVMTIPANVRNGEEIRPAQTGPVFSVDDAGHLHMRYSARTRNVVWKDDRATQAAVQALVSLFREDSPYIVRHRLKSGEGVLSNNVLHCRTAFEDDAERGQVRLLYRARYFDRIVDTRMRRHAVLE